MAGQTPSRRQLLQALACASVASTAPGFVRWSFAFAEPAQATSAAHHTHTPVHTIHSPAGTYKPRFFTPAEYTTLEVLAELIIPNTAPEAGRTHTGPGAHHRRPDPAYAGATDAGVAEFVDFMVSADPTLHDPFRSGLAWLDTAAKPGPTFHATSPESQNALLTRLAFKKNFQDGEKPGQDFFVLMRRYTVMGFYTTELGLKQLDYPGLQFYGESPSVPKDGPLAAIVAKAGQA